MSDNTHWEAFPDTAPAVPQGAPVMWVMRAHETGQLEPARPHQKAKHPKIWSDAFPLYAAPSQETALTGCNCRWDGDKQVEWCELHLAHKDAIHEWAERAKNAEAKLAQMQPSQPVTLTEREVGDCIDKTNRESQYGQWQFGWSKDLAANIIAAMREKEKATREWHEILCELAEEIERLKPAAPPAAAPAPAVPQGWHISERKIDGQDAVIINGPMGGCVAYKDSDIPRVLPESILYELATAMLAAAPSQEPVTLPDEYAGVIAWIGDKQCKLPVTEDAIKHEHTPGVVMRNTAHACVQEVIAALREKQAKTPP